METYYHPQNIKFINGIPYLDISKLNLSTINLPKKKIKSL